MLQNERLLVLALKFTRQRHDLLQRIQREEIKVLESRLHQMSLTCPKPAVPTLSEKRCKCRNSNCDLIHLEKDTVEAMISSIEEQLDDSLEVIRKLEAFGISDWSLTRDEILQMQRFGEQYPDALALVHWLCHGYRAIYKNEG